MSFDAAFAAAQLPALYRTFGVDALVRRGGDAPKAVRVIVDSGVERYGTNGEVVGSVTLVSFMRSQWAPKPHDIVTIGPWEKKVEVLDSDDGIEAKAVLHG